MHALCFGRNPAIYPNPAEIRLRISGFIIIIIIIIMVYFRQQPIEHKIAMNNKTERQTEYKRTETATKRHMHTMK